MRRALPTILVSTITAAALAIGGIAVAGKPTVVRAGNLVLKLNGGVTPKKLPKNKLAPIALRVAGSISTADGSQPPVAKQVIADFDRHGTVNARGLATCKRGKLEARDTRAAKTACRKAIVGTGSTTVRVAFPDSTPFKASGPLVLFNGGVRLGVTTMFIHAYVAVPVPTALVTEVKIKKIRKGRFGTRAIARIPTIAGGSGAVTRFDLVVKRRFKRNGEQQSYLLARCANGRFFAHGTVAFKGGTRIAGTVVRPCQMRG
jgi:hypothetical protein